MGAMTDNTPLYAVHRLSSARFTAKFFVLLLSESEGAQGIAILQD